jgi:biopolymer transport protein ExbD
MAQPRADLNLTPLIDVLLVLIVILKQKAGAIFRAGLNDRITDYQITQSPDDPITGTST